MALLPLWTLLGSQVCALWCHSVLTWFTGLGAGASFQGSQLIMFLTCDFKSTRPEGAVQLFSGGETEAGGSQHQDLPAPAMEEAGLRQEPMEPMQATRS